MSLFDRNKAILQAILAGQSYDECATTHALTKTTAMTAVRSILKALKEHTDISLNICTSAEYLRQYREAILRALKAPIPTIPITGAAKAYLKHRFGKYYASRPKEVAAAWPEIQKNFHATRESRDLLSMQTWLASEDHFVGDYISPEMSGFAYAQLGKRIQGADVKDGRLHFKVTATHSDKTGLMLQVALADGDHVVEQQMTLKLQTQQK